MTTKKNDKKAANSVASAFGAVNRERLINEYFSGQKIELITPQHAWKHVYRLLLWVDQTTGLGHCYESDKSQPGKGWYVRSLAFHKWAADSLGSSPGEVSKQIDWLFTRAAEDLAAYVTKSAAKLLAKADKQREPYEGQGFPMPGENPELVSIIKETLGDHLRAEPPEKVWTLLVQKIRQYFALDNKRKNLVGEGFEDVLAQVVERTCNRADLTVHTRSLLQKIPGFGNSRDGEKVIKVDLALVRPKMRTLVTSKWSVRADREKQFTADFTDYLKAESSSKPFEYVFVTNEFDPARLMRACAQLNGHVHLFAHVVHINTDAIRATYSPAINSMGEQKKSKAKKNKRLPEGATDKATSEDEKSSMEKVLNYIDEGRLISLEQWIKKLESEY